MTKYDVPDGHWEEDDPEPVDDVSPLTTLDDHVVRVVHDPYEGRRLRYSVHIAHDFEDSPLATLARKARWKGNYWREYGDPIDWADVPTAVQLTVVRVVADVDEPDDLDPGERFWSAKPENSSGSEGVERLPRRRRRVGPLESRKRGESPSRQCERVVRRQCRLERRELRKQLHGQRDIRPRRRLVGPPLAALHFRDGNRGAGPERER